MAQIEYQPAGVLLGEGAAVRVGRTAQGEALGETHIYFEPWEESKTVRMTDADVKGDGRILDVSMTLKNVAPAKRIAVGISAYEVDPGGNEHTRGFRAVTVPPHNGPGCRDVETPVLRFVLPEDLRPEGCAFGGRRHFVLRAAVHPIDSGAEL